jgi:RHS repeat-associated protein
MAVRPRADLATWGYETDPSGLLQLGARWYWPEIGRFLTQDPIGAEMNPYAYAGNNPVVRVDPEGTNYADIEVNIPVVGIPWLFGIGPMFGLMLGPDPCANPPHSDPWLHPIAFFQEWWHQNVHFYAGAGAGFVGGSATYAPGTQTPGHGGNAQISGGFAVGGAAGYGYSTGTYYGEVGANTPGYWGGLFWAW